MKKLNGNCMLKNDLRIKIYDYFEYKWTHDRNSAIDDPHEI